MPAWSQVEMLLDPLFQQPAPKGASGLSGWGHESVGIATVFMGLAHCPLCIALAVISLVRGGALGVLLFRLCIGESQSRWRLNAA